MTDIGSRGLDILSVGLVIHYDFPRNYEDYVHRSGRAARGGKLGRTLSLVTQYDTDLLKDTEKKAQVKF